MFKVRKIRWSIVSGLALLLVASLLFASCAPAGPTPTTPEGQVVPVSEPIYKWRFQSSDVSPAIVSYWERFAEHVKVMTGGRLEITPYRSGELVASGELFDAVAAGTIELGSLYSFLAGGKMPIAKVMYTIPFVIDTFEEGRYLLRETRWTELLQEAYDEYDIHLISAHRNLWQYGNFMSTVPVSNIADIKGLKMRSTGVYARLYEKLGASIVSMAKGEMFTALATGVVDAVQWGAPHAYYDLNFHDVAKYYTMPPLQRYGQWDMIINNALWNELPDDIKLVLPHAAIEANIGVNVMGWSRDADALASMQEAGVTITTLPEEDIALMKKIVWEEIYPEFAAADPLTAQAVEILEGVAILFGHR